MSVQAILPMADYAADNTGAPEPTLNSSLAHRLLTHSPFHAWWGHPRLNPEWTPQQSEAFDLGTAVHDLVIEGRTDRICVVQADSWRTKEAREQRDAARAAGKLPLLPEQAAAVLAMAGPALAALEMSPDLVGLGELDAERTFVWQDESTGAWLRCRPDWVTKDRSIILSFKTTSASAEPTAFAKTIMNFGYDLQAAFEIAGVEAVCGTRVTHYVWVVQEVQPPYAVSLVGMSPEMRHYGLSRFDLAVSRWAECLAADRWPGYPTRICYVDPPSWAMTRMEEEIS